MLWLFVIFGLFVFTAAAFGFLSTARIRSSLSAIHFIALFLVAVAWVMGHKTGTGWTALLAGSFLEIVAWGRVLVAANVGGEGAVPQPVPAEERSRIDEFPAADSRPMLSFESVSLLASVWQAAPEVFLASLRRGGRRDATLTGATQHTAQFGIGAAILEMRCESAPLARDQVEYALSQTFDWPEARRQTQGHAAHVVFKSSTTDETPRLDVVRLHLLAHTALAEFAPVVAVLWAGAGRLMSIAGVRGISKDRLEPTEVCINFRSFALDAEDAGKTLCDTVGLHAFGLPDLQIVVNGEPNEGISEMLYAIARESFGQGRVLNEGEVLSQGGVQYTVRKETAGFPPERIVLSLTVDDSASASR